MEQFKINWAKAKAAAEKAKLETKINILKAAAATAATAIPAGTTAPPTTITADVLATATSRGESPWKGQGKNSTITAGKHQEVSGLYQCNTCSKFKYEDNNCLYIQLTKGISDGYQELDLDIFMRSNKIDERSKALHALTNTIQCNTCLKEKFIPYGSDQVFKHSISYLQSFY